MDCRDFVRLGFAAGAAAGMTTAVHAKEPDAILDAGVRE
jgi:amidase